MGVFLALCFCFVDIIRPMLLNQFTYFSMDISLVKTLLPAGCYDVLPPLARQETQLSGALMHVFESFGYEQVAPPLLEFSDNLLAGRGATLSNQMFRVMDPTAHRVMAIRPDITLQIARIAASRLRDMPRPLRLCYNGLILRMGHDPLRGDRQFRQAGIELIGAASPEADAEVILVAAEALSHAGIQNFSIDVNLPGIVASMLASDKLSNEELDSLFDALAHKDVARIHAMRLTYRDSIIGLIQTAGPARAALAAIERLDLPTSARALCNDLREVVNILEKQNNTSWVITIDAAESRGYAYHSGVGFSLFVPGVAREVGRGGRYRIDNEEATGFTLYLETLRELTPAAMPQQKVLVAEGVNAQSSSELRAQGYITINALEGAPLAEQAKKLGCGFLYQQGKLVKV